MGSDLRSIFAHGILKQVETLVLEGKIGLCAGTLRIIDVSTSRATNAKKPAADRFKLVVPYAGNSVTWEILFNGHYPSEPPDFIFGPDDSDFQPNIESIKSLADWNGDDECSLLNVVEDLIQHYGEYQRNLIKDSSRLQFEYTSLIDHADYKPSDIEILTQVSSKGKLGTVYFLVKLPLDFARIPPFLTKDNPGEDRAVLLVTYQTPEGSKVTPQLYLSPRLEYCLGGSAGLRIPSFPAGGCLIDYVPTVCEQLEGKIDHVVQSFERRKEYISAFLSHYGRSVLEFDTEGFSTVSFLMEWHDFFFIVCIDVPVLFPADQPIFRFQSVYHECDGKPYSKVVKEYPYSPRWSGNEMAERARSYILEYVSAFQRASVTDGSLS